MFYLDHGFLRRIRLLAAMIGEQKMGHATLRLFISASTNTLAPFWLKVGTQVLRPKCDVAAAIPALAYKLCGYCVEVIAIKRALFCVDKK